MRAFFLGVALAALVLPAAAQQNPADQTRLAVQDMNFDLWCQETEGLPPDRCDRRIPEDEARFEAYRSQIEKYEIPYLQQKQDQQVLSRVILHADPSPNEEAVNHPADEQVNGPKPNH
ncbi:MAG TPA: hypothetical protein VGG10_12130 [Rhizomicrobium sp.]|jgi:hypothetical protein